MNHTLELVITDKHRQKAIKALRKGERTSECCLIAQALKEQFNILTDIGIGFVNAYINKEKWKLDEIGQEITHTFSGSWNEINLPQKVTLTHAD